MTKLTVRQSQVYDFIVTSVRSGRPPTFRDIMDEIGASSTNAATCHLKALAKKGYITILPGARGIRLANQDTCPLCGKPQV